MTRDQVFISYSRKDRDWLERLQTMLVPLTRAGFKIWADTDIKPGEEWKKIIEQALTRTKVAVLLVSPNFLASRFIHENELPPLLEAARNEGLTILWVPVRPSSYKRTTIADYQAAHPPAIPLTTLDPPHQEKALVRIAESIEEALLATPIPSVDSAEKTTRAAIYSRYDKVQTRHQAETEDQAWLAVERRNRVSDSGPNPSITTAPDVGNALPAVIVTPASQQGVLAKPAALLPIQNIHGWPAQKVQELQQQTALALGLKVEFCDILKLDDSQGPEMIVIPAGQFLMGSPTNEPEWHSDERPRHKVIIAKPFAIGRYTVTFDEYELFCDATDRSVPNSNWGRGQQPVIYVSWHDAVAYCAWLSQETGATYRLPSEAEWEYEARAGTTTTFWWGNDIDTMRANYNGNSVYRNGPKGEYRRQTVPVDAFQPNPFGLYQVHGNIWEWVQDNWHGNYEGAPVDGSAWVKKDDASSCVLRGGSWDDGPRWLRGAARSWIFPLYRDNGRGFRLARTFSL